MLLVYGTQGMWETCGSLKQCSGAGLNECRTCRTLIIGLMLALKQFSVTGRRLRNDLIQYWKIFHGQCSVRSHDLFTMAPQRAATRGHCFKIAHVRTQTDVRKRAFAVRCIEAWNSLPDHVVSETDFTTFKRLLADSLGERLYDFPD